MKCTAIIIYCAQRKDVKNKLVVTNLRTGLDQWTNTLMHFTWSSPHFIHVRLVCGLAPKTLNIKMSSVVVMHDEVKAYKYSL